MVRLLAAVLMALLAFGGASEAFGAASGAMTTESILAKRAALDGKSVTFEGEAIGEVLRADAGGVWLAVLDGDTALSVYLPAEDAEVVSIFGDWSHTGDRVRVSGEFHRACDQHGGDLDIHGTTIDVMASGVLREHATEPWKMALAAAGFALAGASAGYSRWRRRIRQEG